MKIGIVGNGYVGQATALLECDDLEVLAYDTDKSKCNPPNLKLEDLRSCDYLFVCVPTPMTERGEPVTDIVEDCVANLLLMGYDKSRIILKSTVPVGTSERLGVMFMPEFLTEGKWKEDFINHKNWILGTNERDEKIRDDIYEIFSLAYQAGKITHSPNILFCTTQEAELIKYVRNCFLATKVSFFNEINEFCLKNSISFDKVRELACLDSRVGCSHTNVPGPDGQAGFGGTCFPKDINSLLHQMDTIAMDSYIIQAVIKRNEEQDRAEQDWKLNRGRAVI